MNEDTNTSLEELEKLLDDSKEQGDSALKELEEANRGLPGVLKELEEASRDLPEL